MNITICPMQECDFPIIQRLIMVELGYQDNTAEKIYQRLREIQMRSTNHTLVARYAEKTIAFAGLSEEIAYETEGNYLRVTALAVLREYQNQGIGKQLLQAVEAYAKSQGISSISLNSGLQRHEAHLFYEHFGFHKKGYSFHKEI